MSKTLSLVLLPFLSLPALAYAQDAEPEPEPEAGEEVELGDEGVTDDFDPDSSSGTLGGEDENPTDPNSPFGDAPVAAPKAAEVATGYPQREIDRPLNLPGGMSEITFAIPLAVDPFAAAATVAGTYGITNEVQAGLRYGLGRYQDDFSVGKAVSLEGQYLVTDFLAAQLSVPLYLDPFAFGVVLGAPVRFTFFDTFTLVAGQDLVSIRVVEFLPSIDNATQNDAFIAKRAINETVPLYIGNLTGGAIYQVDDNIAVDLQLGTTFDDTIDAARALMNVGLQYSTSNMLDFGARLGSSDLSQFTETLELRTFLNLRI